MKKLIFLPVWMLIAASQLTGQVFIGPKAGVALSNYKSSGVIADEFNSILKPGFLAGAVLEVPFSSRFGIQLEGIYVQKGGTYEPNANGLFAGEKCRHQTLPYLSLPIFFKYRFQGRPLGGFISAGSELSFAFNGKGWQEGEKKNTIEVGSGANDFYKKSDIGLLIGGGVTYDVSIGELVLDARYVMGLTNINGELVDISVLPSTKNRSLQISLGIIFPMGG